MPNNSSHRGSSGNRKRSAQSKKAHEEQKRIAAEQSKLKSEIVFLCSMALCIFLFLCNFGILGPVGALIKSIQFGLFGVLSYGITIVIPFLVMFWIANKKNASVKVKIVCAFIMLFVIGMLIELCTVKFANLSDQIFTDLWLAGYKSFKGAGILCGIVTYFLHRFVNTVGTVLICILLLVICLVVITGKSIKDSMRRSADNVSKKMKDGSERHKEQAQLRREERAEERANRRLMEEQARREAEERRKDAKDENASDSVETKNSENVSAPENIFVKRTEKKGRGVTQDTLLKAADTTKPQTGENLHEITYHEPDPDDTNMENDASSMDRSSQYDIPNPKGDFHRVADTVNRVEEAPKPIPAHPVSPVLTPPEPHTKATSTTESIAPMTTQTPTAGSVSQSRPAPKTKTSTGGKIRNPEAPYQFPPLSLLRKPDNSGKGDTQAELRATGEKLLQTLEIFGVKAKITEITKGPSVTRFELQPELGVKVSKVVALSDDIKLSLAATEIRIEAPIPGKSAIGIEIPNREKTSVTFYELITQDVYKQAKSKLTFAVGKDLGGETVVSNIAKMPHMMLAGTTGSGKSVCMNTLIMSILYKATPEEVKMIMIDPKVVEMSIYNGLPHLMLPVITDVKKAAGALQWAVGEMNRRYKLFANNAVKDLETYNALMEQKIANGDITTDPENPIEKLSQVVIIIDELADLMMAAQAQVEEPICRLAQLARAAGLHLIIATQSPRADVVTGLIKANIPSKLALKVSSGLDSRIILDMGGAEKLLGNGDMLFFPQGYPKPARVQGAYLSEEEIGNVVKYIIDHNGSAPDPEEMMTQMAVMASENSNAVSIGGDSDNGLDPLFAECGRFIIDKEKASIGNLQRAFKIGFNRAARIMDQLCDNGVVGPEVGTKPREILMGSTQFEELLHEFK